MWTYFNVIQLSQQSFLWSRNDYFLYVADEPCPHSLSSLSTVLGACPLRCRGTAVFLKIKLFFTSTFEKSSYFYCKNVLSFLILGEAVKNQIFILLPFSFKVICNTSCIPDRSGLRRTRSFSGKTFELFIKCFLGESDE